MLAGALTIVWPPQPATAQQVFHSTQTANLPTAEMLRQGNLLFEISHRFLPAVSDGAGALWGLDGPVWNRLGLSYQATDRLMVGILRSNLNDVLELGSKVGLGDMALGDGTLKLAAAGGIAWNTGATEISNPGAGELQEDNEMQLYAQLLANVLVGERVAIGLVPTYLRNPRLLDEAADDALALGLQGQWYRGGAVSLHGEWIFTEAREGLEHDSGTFGIEIETRGHFFKIMVTNQSRMNPTHFLGGTPVPFELDELRLGFNITRLLPF